MLESLDPMTALVTATAIFIGMAMTSRAKAAATTTTTTTPNRDKSNGKQVSTKTSTSSSSFSNFPPVGVVRSCFRECRGTPRQGSFAPSTRGHIDFERSIPADSLDGLEHFSHVWILFVFHKNTNFHHSKRAHEGGGSHSFRSKIKPPKLQGKSVGVFATRTPHRPNAIGITLARVESVQGRRVVLSALDLIDGTPVLDIKPYVTPYDSVPGAGIPHWCGAMPPSGELRDYEEEEVGEEEEEEEEGKKKRGAVTFDEHVVKTMDDAASSGQLNFYDNGQDVRRAIVELLTSDVRPASSYRSSKAKQNDTCHFRFDMLLIGFVRRPADNVIARVLEVTVENKKIEKEIQSGKRARYPRSRSKKR